jgi:hypothetical protein
MEASVTAYDYADNAIIECDSLSAYKVAVQCKLWIYALVDHCKPAEDVKLLHAWQNLCFP